MIIISRRLTLVAALVLLSLLFAATVQISTLLRAIPSYDRGRTAVVLTSRLHGLTDALEAYQPRADRPARDAQTAAIVAAIDRVDAAARAHDAEIVLGPPWAAVRDRWHAQRPAPAIASDRSGSESDLRLVYRRLAAIALGRENDPSLGPLGESALLALPILALQERRMSALFANAPSAGASLPADPTIDLVERYTRADASGVLAFLSLDSPWAANRLPAAVRAQAREAQTASRAFLTAVERSVRSHRAAKDRERLAALGAPAVARVGAFEETLLPLLDEKLATAREGAMIEIVAIVLLVLAVGATVSVLAIHVLRSQLRSRASREALEHQARHDALTGLPNRRAFTDATATVVERWTPINDRTTHILSIDLDYFKEVNDRYGHQTGDEFLIAAAERLRRAIPETETIARVGGDEFAVLVRHYDPDSAYALEVAQAICEAFDEPIAIEGVRHRLAASVGLVAVDALHETVDSLLRDADIAMYRAKEDGGNRVVVFDDTLRGEIVHRAELAAALPASLHDGSISVVFQPIVSLDHAVETGFEALVRWKHPEHGQVSAALLIDIAQDSRLIDQLGRVIVHEVCRHLAEWRTAGVALETISVHFNISPMEAVHGDTFGSIAHALEQYDIPPRTLVVELTETASMDSVDTANLFLNQLHAIDVRICLDDFGTGYSSLRHLNDFHVDAIKIDRSFVVSAAEDPAKIPIIAGIIALAHGLDAEVIAEGIETADQLAIIERLGCRLVQGYLFSRPLAPDAALAFAQRFLTAAT